MPKYLILILFSLLLTVVPQKNKNKNGTDKKNTETTIELNYPAKFDDASVPKEIKKLLKKPLYTFTEEDIDLYLGFLKTNVPNLRDRIQFLARQNMGQSYNIYLLGEFPFEIKDKQPLYNLKQSDCVVFAEHIYAMSLSSNWKEFFAMLQRIRYKDGEIGMLTRNHYTEADWVKNNTWLITEITDEIGGNSVAKTSSEIDRAKFFKKHALGQNIPKEKIEWTYIPGDSVYKVLPYLRTGDFVNIVRGYPASDPWVGHVGLISVEENGTVNFMHSADPVVKTQTLQSYWDDFKAKPKKKNGWQFLGFRFTD
ncbi:MAG: DUF1460 domain-containing protein [Ignavibacteriales bacterium]|nr:DUF1460 domain-containing protein [Ignavibacteriales bacterium]